MNHALLDFSRTSAAATLTWLTRILEVSIRLLKDYFEQTTEKKIQVGKIERSLRQRAVPIIADPSFLTGYFQAVTENSRKIFVYLCLIVFDLLGLHISHVYLKNKIIRMLLLIHMGLSFEISDRGAPCLETAPDYV